MSALVDPDHLTVYSLQEKGWNEWTPREVSNIWWEWYGRLQGWQEGVRDLQLQEAEEEVARVAKMAEQSWIRQLINAIF